MSKSFQNEIPKARVNITLDVDTNGAKKKKELPMKLLVLGSFSHGKETKAIAERDRVAIHRDNLNEVIKDINPELTITVPNVMDEKSEEIKTTIRIQDYKDFQPDNIATQVPELKLLIAMRNILKDLKANVLDNKGFRKELELIIKDKSQVNELGLGLKQLWGEG